MRKFLRSGQLMYFCGALALILATIIAITWEEPIVSFIPNIKTVDIIVNSFCAVSCIILIINPYLKTLSYIIFFLEATISVLTGLVGIGTHLFLAGCMLMFVNGEFMTKRKLKSTVILLYWEVVIVTTYFGFGIEDFLFQIALTFFYVILAAFFYYRLESSLSYLLHDEVVNPNVELPPKGSQLNLADYGLSKRQIRFIVGAVQRGETYDTLAKKEHVSLSVVKKDMAGACKIFGVANKEALRILLLQYIIKVE